MAVLKIVPKLYQEKISEKLKEEIALVTTGEAKYYNRLYKFFQYTDIQCTADINYETRKMYMDSLEKEDISEKYKAELLSLFDRLSSLLTIRVVSASPSTSSAMISTLAPD